MRINSVPATSFEVRWFLEGTLAQQDGLKRWFHTAAPWPGGADAPAGSPTRDAVSSGTDVYLVIPGAADMGVKWRDGRLYVKGRMQAIGPQPFCGRFQGRLERWVRWSYDDLSAFYRHVFSAPPVGVVTVPIRKTRTIRKIRVNPRNARAEEVPVATRLERGMLMELTDVEVNGITFCSLGFKAFPDDRVMADRFIGEVNTRLKSLRYVDLGAANSQSYPAWLGTIAGCNARPVAASTGSWRLAAAW